MRYHLTRLRIIIWGVTLWSLLPILPRTWGLAALHRYFRAAYTWRSRWVPSRARLVARWEAERHLNYRS